MRLPQSDNRLAVIGATGSGKSHAALWHLSLQDIDKRPWLIYNFKNEKLIDNIPMSHPIGMNEVPIKPGVYIAHPLPHQNEAVETQMWSIWEKEGIGIYIDEGYMIGRHNAAYRALLTQGRSKEIPIITLSQRPRYLDPFALSEAEFYQIFRLQWEKDRKAVEEFVPADLSEPLPIYHSHYYDVGENRLHKLAPVPDMKEIYRSFEHKLRTTRKTT